MYGPIENCEPMITAQAYTDIDRARGNPATRHRMQGREPPDIQTHLTLFFARYARDRRTSSSDAVKIWVVTEKPSSFLIPCSAIVRYPPAVLPSEPGRAFPCIILTFRHFCSSQSPHWLFPDIHPPGDFKSHHRSFPHQRAQEPKGGAKFTCYPAGQNSKGEN